MEVPIIVLQRPWKSNGDEDGNDNGGSVGSVGSDSRHSGYQRRNYASPVGDSPLTRASKLVFLRSYWTLWVVGSMNIYVVDSSDEDMWE